MLNIVCSRCCSEIFFSSFCITLDIFWAGPPALACTSFGFLINNNSEREREKRKRNIMEFYQNKDFLARPSVPSLIRTEMFERRTIDLPSSAHQELNVEEVCNILIIHWIFIVQLSALCSWGSGLSSFILFTWCAVGGGGGDIVSVVLICCADWARSRSATLTPPHRCVA